MSQQDEPKSSENSTPAAGPYSHPKLTAEQKHRLFSQAARAVAHDRQTTAEAAMKADQSQ